MNSGVYTQLVKSPSNNINIEKLKDEFLSVNPKSHYEYMAGIGIFYGPAFQAIRQIWKGNKEALLFIALDQSIQFETGYHLHPTLLDACFQGVACAVQNGNQDEMYIPASIGMMKINNGTSIRKLWCHIKVLEINEHEICSDIQITDEYGEIIGSIANFTLQKVQQPLLPMGNVQDLYTLSWNEVALNNHEISIASAQCVIFADEQRIGERLAQQIGTSAIVVQKGERFQVIDNRRYIINPNSKEHLKQLFMVLGNELKIIYCWGMDILESQNSIQAINSYTNLIYLVQEMSVKKNVSKFWIITNHANAVNEEEKISTYQAPLWGFGRTFAIAKPDIWGGLIDIERDISKVSKSIVHDIFSDVKEKQITYRGSKKYVARLNEVKYERAVKQKKPVKISPNHAYLITGGLGFLGLTFAKWLVGKGAKQIVLMGRTKLPSRNEWNKVTDKGMQGKIQAIVSLEKLGAEVHVITIDVSNEGEMVSFFANYQNYGIREIKGIIHAAGTVYNQSIEEITKENILEMMKPKVIGSIHLHHNFKDKELDFFVLFSSITSLIAPPRLSIYAAANAFLDALAYERQREGLTAVSINWGPWSEAGMAAQSNDSNETAGMQHMSVQDGLNYFETALKLELPQIAITKVNWQSIRSQFPSIVKTSFLNEVITEAEQKENNSKVNEIENMVLIDRLMNETSEQKIFILKGFLREEIAAILKVSANSVEDDTSLLTLGLDSMMAVEFSNRIEVQVKVNIPIATFLKGASIEEIANIITEELEELGTPLDVKRKNNEVFEDNQSNRRTIEYPLSQGQRSLWFLQKVSPENTAYNVAFAVKVLNGLNINYLKETLTILVKTHESLRMKVLNKNGEPYQQITNSNDYEFTLKNVKGYSNDAVKELTRKDIHRPFNLSKDPMVRAFVYKCDDYDILMIVIHHIAIDYWGIELFLKDFKAVYTNLSTQKELPILGRKHSYSEFVTWQEEFLQKPAAQKQLDFWINELSDDIQELDLPIDYSVPKKLSSEGDAVPFTIHSATLQKIKNIIKSEETTLFVFLLSIYQLLLHRYSGQDELIVGSPTNGRSKASFDSIIGDFINMLPLKSSIGHNPTFKQYLKANKESVIHAIENQDYPFPLLVEKIKPNRNPVRSPIFQTSFILQSINQLPELSGILYNEDGKEFEFANLMIRPYEVSQQEGQLDLTLEITEASMKLNGALKYNKQLFKRESIERMIKSYITLIEQVINDPEIVVKKLSLLNKEDERHYLTGWNNNIKEFEPYENLIEVIEKIASQMRSRVAVEYEDKTLSYEQLLEQVNKIAHNLYQLNIQKGDRIGIFMNRGVEMVAALLGVMKVGAIYVPMDPSFPKERLDWMIEDGDIHLVLTNRDLKEEELNQQVSRILVEEIMELPCEVEMNEYFTDLTGEDSAYIIYTSGSTGKPKGVEIQHKALVNFLQSMAVTPGIDKEDRVLAITTLSFDISILEIFLPLTVGAKSIILGREDTIDGNKLRRKLEKLKPTIVQATPVTWRMLLDYGWHGDSQIKALCGGEALTIELAKKMKEKCGEVWNVYGPTEATVWMTVKEIQLDIEKVTIGKPIHNMNAYILDDYLNPVPIGVTGHLYIGGIGLAKGYLNRPDLNDEKFKMIHFSDLNEKRVYSTGDLARILPNGDIDYLGRSDNQVKVNGYRIELAEIESLLNDYPPINESVVIANKGRESAQLIGFIKAEESAVDIKIEEIRAYLKKKLPDYMIPTLFIKIDKLPLTPNGKVDRKELQHLEGQRLELSTTFIAPETQIEKKLSKIWSEILNKEKVGVNDNFFDLGGTSLLAAKLQQEINEKLGIQMTILDIFQYPSIQSLCEFLENNETENDEQDRTEKLEKGKKRLHMLREQRKRRK